MNRLSRHLQSITLLLGALSCSFPIGAQINQHLNDPLYQSSDSWGQEGADQWALHALNLPNDLQDTNRFLQPPLVAVIDTGVDHQHPDFSRRGLWRNPAEAANGRDDDNNGYVDDLVGWNFVDGDNNPFDLSGHGTHIAGIINACTNNGVGIAAVAPNTRVLPLKVANFVGQARSSAIAAAIHYAIAANADVINLSMGGAVATDIEAQAIATAVQANILVVVSAGNNGRPADQFGFAALPGVLTVGASDSTQQRAGFSSFGAEVDVLAPGIDVLSLRARDTDFIALTKPQAYESGSAVLQDTYYRASGTSFSAALVSGLAARLKAQRPNLSAAAIRRLLVQNARDVGLPGVDQLSGYGVVDYSAAAAGAEEFYIDARISGVELRLEQESVWVDVKGQAAADQLHSSKLEFSTLQSADEEIGELQSRQWQPITDQKSPSQQAPDQTIYLGHFNLNELVGSAQGAQSWALRLTVAHSNGRQRQALMKITLPTVGVAR